MAEGLRRLLTAVTALGTALKGSDREKPDACFDPLTLKLVARLLLKPPPSPVARTCILLMLSLTSLARNTEHTSQTRFRPKPSDPDASQQASSRAKRASGACCRVKYVPGDQKRRSCIN